MTSQLGDIRRIGTQAELSESHKQGRFFRYNYVSYNTDIPNLNYSMFSLVNFPNDECSSNESECGTCMTAVRLLYEYL